MNKLNYAIVGATGKVGRKMISELEKSELQVGKLKLFASSKSVGKTLQFRGEEIVVEETNIDSFEGIDIALFSAGSSVSSSLAPLVAEKGIYVIDNTSFFRMNPNIPLVVPEVNFGTVETFNSKLIANPNCSTIQMVVALKPLHNAFKLKRIIVSTYQAVSGAGTLATNELFNQQVAISSGNEIAPPEILPTKGDKMHYPIINNVIPQIDKFDLESGFSIEELKMINETKKIFNVPHLDVVATCVRVPVDNCHSESVYVEFENDIDLIQVRSILSKANGVVLLDKLENQIYPMPSTAVGSSKVFVGRLRVDPSNPKGLHMFIVADNLLKGAASNSVQIAELLVSSELIGTND